MSRIKVGIVTFQRSYNYGAVLQAYALQKVVEHMGVEAETLDYRPPVRDQYFFKRPPLFSKKKPLHWFCYYMLNAILLKRPRADRYKRFARFMDEDMALSEKWFRDVDQVSEYIKEQSIDTLICGSDQIWNIFRYGADDVLFLNFGSEKLHRISYAVSLGDLNPESLSSEQREYFRAVTSRFDHLAVREESAVGLIRDQSNIIPELVLDPTLLLLPDDWVFRADDSLVPKEPYILCYFIRIGDSILKWAEAISEKMGLPIYCIDRNGETLYRPKIHGIYNVGPKEFLGLVKNASFFLTTSFHGTIFAILFGVPFVVDRMNGSEKNKRVADLLSMLSLEDRLVGSDVCVQDALFLFDNTAPMAKITKRREESLEYLKISLGDSIG